MYQSWGCYLRIGSASSGLRRLITRGNFLAEVPYQSWEGFLSLEEASSGLRMPSQDQGEASDVREAHDQNSVHVRAEVAFQWLAA